MHYIQPMNVFHPVEDLLEDLASLPLRHPASRHLVLFILDDVVEEFAVGRILHHQKQVLGRFDQLVQLDDVGVANQLQYVDL